jgi:hypothetical protein
MLNDGKTHKNDFKLTRSEVIAMSGLMEKFLEERE